MSSLLSMQPRVKQICSQLVRSSISPYKTMQQQQKRSYKVAIIGAAGIF